MSFQPGDKVVVRGTLGLVVSDEMIAGQEFVGVVDPRAVQYIPAALVNAPATPAGPASPAMPPTPAGHAVPVASPPLRPR